jgi:hypothetical protein
MVEGIAAAAVAADRDIVEDLHHQYSPGMV